MLKGNVIMADNENLDIDLRFLADVNLNITVEIGKITKLFKYIYNLKEGDIIDLKKPTESLVDIYLNKEPFAQGEIVVINEKYGVRIISLVG